MVYYVNYQDNRKNVGTHLWYARAVHTSTMNTRAMARHIMEHGLLSQGEGGVMRDE